MDTLDKHFYIFKNKNNIEFIYSGYSGLVLEYNTFIKKSVNHADEVDTETYAYLFEDPFIKVDFPYLTNDAEVDTIEIMIRDHTACSSCHAHIADTSKSNPIDLHTFQEGIAYFISTFSHTDILNICFSSVQNTEDFYTIQDVVKRLKNVQQDYENITFCYSVIVNEDISYDNTIRDFLIENDFEITINIGEKKCTSYDDLVMDSDCIQDICDYLTVKASIVIPYFEADLRILYEQLCNLGIKEISLQFPLEHDINDIEEAKATLAKNIDTLVDYFIANMHQKKLLRITTFLDALYAINYGSRKGPRYFPCSAGKSIYSININGDIYPCRRLSGIEQYKWNNISQPFDNDRRREFLSNHMVFIRDSGKCLECWAKYLCGGTCYYGSHKAHNDTNSIWDMQCYFNRLILKKVLYIYASLEDDERTVLSKVM